jgi:transposase
MREYAREGLELDRSTLCDWVGQAAWLLDPIVAAIRTHVFSAEKIRRRHHPRQEERFVRWF